MRNFLRLLRRPAGTARARIAALAATAVLVVGGVTAALLSGGGETGPRPVSADEAQRMALARFRTYEESPSEVTVRVPVEGGRVTVRAVVDHHVHRAVGAYEVAEPHRTLRGVLAWDRAGIAVAHKQPTAPASGTSDDGAGGASGDTAAGDGRAGAPAQVTRAPARDIVTSAAQAARIAGTLTAGDWTRRPYSTAPLDRTLQLVLSMAADRLENAQLMARSGPLWLRDDRVDSHGYDVFSGPRPRPGASAHPQPTASPGLSPLSYWIDTDGDLRRITARLAPGRNATIDLVAARVHTGVPGAPWQNSPGQR